MSYAQYFTPVPDASVTFNGANVQINPFDPKNATSKDNFNNLESNDDLLQNLTFQANKGEVVLVLGEPSSGLFKAMFHANQNMFYNPANSVRFKNNEFKSYSKKCPHQIIYNNEQDTHFPFLTVRQTIDFALSCKFRIPREERDQMRDDILEEFGLSHVLDTIVGNDYVRGVSGGERKRISIIETFLSNGSVYLWDNSTKGLDSSTALDFMNILQTLGRATQAISLVKISQASDQIIDKFDKILMLSKNRQIFFGTLDECLDYFINDLGIEKNPNDCIMEYLSSILNLQFNTAVSKTEINNSRKVSKTVTSIISNEEDLYQKWINTEYYKKWAQITESTPDSQIQVDSFNPEDISPIFAVPMHLQLWYCIKRAFERIFGDRAYLIAQWIAVTVQALVIGSLFYDIPMNTVGSYSRGSLTFFSLLLFTFLALADMPASFQRQPIVTKHVQLYFYRNWVETFSSTLYDYLFKSCLVIVFTIILYFLAHFQYTAGRFFVFLLFVGIYNFCMVTLFSLTALMTPTLGIANLVAGILLLAIAMYASYVIYLKDMHPWFVWIAYMNPAMFAMEAILSNELHGLKLDCTDSVIPRGATYSNLSFKHKACAWQGATLGNNYVRGQDYLKSALSYTYHHTWRNFGILIGYLCFYIAFALFASEYVNPQYTKENMDRWRFYFSRFLPFLRNEQRKHVEEVKSLESPNVLNTTVSTTSSLTSSESDNIAVGKGKEGLKLSEDTIEDVSDADQRVEAQSHLISWKNMNYVVGGNKQLINDVSGFIGSGLTALMGESGAGKTTLLNILSQRTDTGVVTGEILIDGKPLTDIESFNRSIGFVQQQDVHLELLTVRESLEISATLRGDGDMNYVDTISHMLRLPGDILVSELSPTERKLLSIGVELVTKPSLLLFLDEPTSGLDSDAALTIVQFLKKLSQQGQAILCTIHQPSKSVISYFDNIFLLKRGGECVYFGPITEACEYFVNHDNSLTYDTELGNPADFVIDVVGSKSQGGEDEFGEKRQTNDWAALWKNSPENRAVHAELETLESEARNSGVDFTTSSWAQPSYLKQLAVITKRQYLCTKRDLMYVLAKFALNAGGGLFIGFSFWKIGYGVLDLQYVIFFCFMSMCLSSPLINQVQDKALISKEVYVAREARSNTYHWTVLLLAQTIIEAPLAISSSTLFFLCSYFCCNFDNSPHIAGVFYFNYIIFSLYYLTFGLWLIFSAPDLQTAAVFVAFFYSFTASFCGVMQPKGLMPGFWVFMYRCSPYTYFIDTFTSVLLHDRKVECSQGELVPTSPDKGNCGDFMKAYVDEFGGYVKVPKAIGVCAYCTYTIGDDFLEVENMSYSHRWRNFGIECAFVAFNFFGMFAGFYLTYIKKVWGDVFKPVKYILRNPLKKKVKN
ncbi:hypothetical protein TBLA_0A01150 [Henningerozyma blattae CBS 6284]|uniref:ABC transporter domain-containing protein n=1 Tax=Henningerozyma blattae (strain ATCC 34711 / CBS 6284 / DSM 70876 / NBRC 10599 / NRRL Y-10934 / UCD 77-7) TaxID=1071380 RepID=I2GUW3_HENB6|nr:hypothetical protein TBLA_0A01150 [Tetrapisispora blattae CBS 6284]CCH57915.1 hypothetical protein TBLA_0A01150 [Tetrapisispora blattae CBS 6284]